MVLEASRRWASNVSATRSDVLGIGVFGSYARGDWGVGSDLDVVIVTEASNRPFYERPLDWDATSLPVPVDLIVYTREEWERMPRESRMGRMLHGETIWLVRRDDFASLEIAEHPA
jgi:predicted nucleotidyltransferase